MAKTTTRRPGTGLKAKPKKVPLPRTPKMVDTKYLGLEPEFDRPMTDNDMIGMTRAYGWYNHFYGLPEAKKWTVEFYTGIKPELAKRLNRIPESHFSTTVGWLCRIESRGFEIPPKSRLWRAAKVNEMIRDHEVVEEVKQEAKIARGPTYKEPGYNADIANIEAMLDDFCSGGYSTPFVTYDYLSKQDTKKTYATAIGDYFRPLLEEIRELKRGKDKDLKEGYSHLNKKQIDTYQTLLANIVSDCERWATNKTKVSRVTRAPRKKSAEQILKTFKYMKDYAPLKVVSIDPATILGASLLVAYNHKYKKVIMYHAKSSEGLSVKGTSVIGFDESLTTGKTLRKPEQQLQAFTTGTAAFVKKQYEQIKSVPSSPSGRISEDVLLLKVFK